MENDHHHAAPAIPAGANTATNPVCVMTVAVMMAVILWGCAGRPSSAVDPLGRYRTLVNQIDDQIRRVETMNCGDDRWECFARVIAIRYRLNQMVRNPAIVQGNCLGKLGFADADGCHMGHMLHVDQSNGRFLQTLLRRNRSPFCSPLPPLAQKQVWYLAQHLDDDPNGLSLRRELSVSLLCALRKGTIDPWQYAAFIDRLRLMQHERQLYGTQFACTAKGARVLAAVSEKELGANRERIGMEETIAETVQRVNRSCGDQE